MAIPPAGSKPARPKSARQTRGAAATTAGPDLGSAPPPVPAPPVGAARRERRAHLQTSTRKTVVFELRGEFIGLDSLLKATGLANSGGAGKALVASGAVRVDGTPELRKTCKIRAGQEVSTGVTQIRVRAANAQATQP